MTISFEEFLLPDIRVGRVVAAELNPKANKPAYRMEIDFGETIGVRISSAQLTHNYTAEELIDTLVVAVVNFEPKRVAGVRSEVLVLGVPDDSGAVVLLRPTADVPIGGRMY